MVSLELGYLGILFVYYLYGQTTPNITKLLITLRFNYSTSKHYKTITKLFKSYHLSHGCQNICRMTFSVRTTI